MHKGMDDKFIKVSMKTGMHEHSSYGTYIYAHKYDGACVGICTDRISSSNQYNANSIYVRDTHR